MAKTKLRLNEKMLLLGYIGRPTWHTTSALVINIMGLVTSQTVHIIAAYSYDTVKIAPCNDLKL